MGKFHAAAALTMLTMDTVEYERQEDGFFHIAHPSHVEAALMHGLIPVPEGVAHPDHFVPVPTSADVQAELAAKDAALADANAANEELRARLEAMEEALAERATVSQATDTATDPADAPGDTSTGHGDTSDLPNADQIGAMSRDEAVEYLAGKGVAIAANSSKADAHDAVTAYVAANTKA